MTLLVSFAERRIITMIVKKIWKDKPMRWRIFFIFLNALFSILCAWITQNLVITSIFIIGTAIIDVLVEIHVYLELKKRIIQIFRSRWTYCFFAFWAFSPTIGGMICKEINIWDNFPSLLFANLVPNILGACIVCSIISHMSKFGYEKIVYTLIQSKKEVLNVFIRLAYFGCFINAVNYNLNGKIKCTNVLNSIYLFLIIFSGTIVVVSFVFRIIDKRKFNYTAKEIYPTKTLFWGGLFLFSCGIGPIFFGIEKHEPILLLMNSITASMIAVFLYVYIVHRTENESNTWLFKPVFGFIVFSIINCIWNFCEWDKTGDYLQQFRSGFGILVFVAALLCYVSYKQNKESKKK